MSSLRGDFEREITFNRRKKGGINVGWAELPTELLVGIIENYLDSVGDYVAVSSVCSSWRKTATRFCDVDKMKKIWASQMPWLMLTDGNVDNSLIDEDELNGEVSGESSDDEDYNHISEDIESNNEMYRRSILNVKQGKFYNLNCPQGYGRSCWGSGHGWIVTTGLDRSMFLFNPLTKVRLNLPSRRTLPLLQRYYFSNQIRRSLFVSKAIVLKVPPISDDDTSVNETNNLLVVVLYDEYTKIAVASPGDTRWRVFTESKTMHIATDVMYHSNHDGKGKGGLVFLNKFGDLACCDLLALRKDQPPALTAFKCELFDFIIQESCNKDPFHVDVMTYTVSSGQDILMVLRILDTINYGGDDSDSDSDSLTDDVDGYRTADFKVYKFHFNDKSWEELHDLQGISIFVGNNSTMCVRATQVGCHPNCIYFTDDCRERYFTTKDRLAGHDMGVFHMNDKVIRPLDVGNNHIRSFYCCSLWFIPTL